MKELNVTEMRAAEGGASTSLSSITGIFSKLTDATFLKYLISFLTAFSTLITAWNKLETLL